MVAVKVNIFMTAREEFTLPSGVQCTQFQVKGKTDNPKTNRQKLHNHKLIYDNIVVSATVSRFTCPSLPGAFVLVTSTKVDGQWIISISSERCVLDIFTVKHSKSIRKFPSTVFLFVYRLSVCLQCGKLFK